MTAILFTVLLLIWLAIYLGEPLKQIRKTMAPADLRSTKLQDDYDRTIEALKDLEFEHAAGKLSDADYGHLNQVFMARAVELASQLKS
ncbi:MAG: hypothetical protein ACREJQ_05440 [bacterium]